VAIEGQISTGDARFVALVYIFLAVLNLAGIFDFNSRWVYYALFDGDVAYDFAIDTHFFYAQVA
jgi:hypothetical protein